MRRLASVKKFRGKPAKVDVILAAVTKDLTTYCPADPVAVDEGEGWLREGGNRVCFIGRFGFVSGRSDE